MPGFLLCTWCHGKGCMCCETERARVEKESAAKRAARASRSPDEIRASIEMLRALLAGDRTNPDAEMMMLVFDGIFDREAIEAEIAKDQALLDAEYDRQFPNGPTPMLSIKRGDETEMELLKHVLRIDVLSQAFGPGGGGVAEIEDRAAEARSLQRLHKSAEDQA